jgi:hypothetical protein
MFSLLALLLPVVYSQATSCEDANGNKCFGQLSDLQSAQQCGNASLVLNERMGHMMSSNEKWMPCACEKLPEIVDCLEKSTCEVHRKAAEDFSGIVSHCDMDHHMGPKSSGSAADSATSASPSPSTAPASDAGAISPVNMCFIALGLLALA